MEMHESSGGKLIVSYDLPRVSQAFIKKLNDSSENSDLFYKMEEIFLVSSCENIPAEFRLAWIQKETAKYSAFLDNKESTPCKS